MGQFNFYIWDFRLYSTEFYLLMGLGNLLSIKIVYSYHSITILFHLRHFKWFISILAGELFYRAGLYIIDWDFLLLAYIFLCLACLDGSLYWHSMLANSLTPHKIITIIALRRTWNHERPVKIHSWEKKNTEKS